MEITEIEEYIECNFIVKKCEIPVFMGLGLLPEKQEIDYNKINYFPYLGVDGIFENAEEATQALWEDFIKFADGKKDYNCFWRMKPKILTDMDFDDNKKKFAARMRLTFLQYE